MSESAPSSDGVFSRAASEREAILEAFVRNLEGSGIISAGDLQAVRDSLPPESQHDAQELARELIRRRALTKYQVQEAYRGKAKDLVLGNYTILDQIGKGGMGQVFKAQHRRMDRIVALKILPTSVSKDQAAVARFQREVKAAAKLNHPNIVTAYDADCANGVHFLVMEYVEGQNLSALVKKHGPVPVEQALSYTLQAARGMEFAHGEGIVHRDIKPSNLLLDKKGTVKVLDMGLARLASAHGVEHTELTGTGQIMGTVDYMAPEQALSPKHADHRADIYSLGITLWYLLTGRSAFAGETVVEKLVAHRELPIPSLREACSAASPALEAVFVKMVAKSPEWRYHSMTEVITALERCRADGASTPAVALSDVVEDIGLHELFRSQTAQSAPAFATKAGRKASAPATALEVTLTLKSPQSDTLVAQTEKPRRLRPPLRLGWSIFLAGGGALLVLATIAFLVDANRGQVKLKQADEVVHQATSQAKKHAWPADAPKPAITSFSAEQAKRYQREWAKHLQVDVTYQNSLGMNFVLIPPGEFTMGSTRAEIEKALELTNDMHWQECIRSEAPKHKVVLTRPFYLGVHEVTQAEYEKVMGKNPSYFAKAGPESQWVEKVAMLDTAAHPVEGVSWNDATEFCAKLSEQEHLRPFYLRIGETVSLLEGTGYRLPTEAEWEFACRAGSTTKYWIGDKDGGLSEAARFSTNSEGRPHRVGELGANPFGLYDIHGNVWEWVQDAWEPAYYGQFQATPAIDPRGPSAAGLRRVIRGGSWLYSASVCRASLRHAFDPSYRSMDIGFRLALPADALSKRPGPAHAARPGLPTDVPAPAIAAFNATTPNSGAVP